MKRFLLNITYCLCLFLGITACSQKKKDNQNSQPVITVTLEPLRYFTEQIAGPNFQVNCMVPEGSSPETYDPTPQQLVELSKSKAYLRIGHIGFEKTWMTRLCSNAPDMQVFDMSEGINLIYGHSHNHDGHTHADGIEPHIWNSTTNARIIANNVCEALCRLDSTHIDFYRHRLDSLNQVINHTDSVVRNLLAENADKAFLIYHPALSYFARDYALEQLCLEDGGKEPSPAHLQSLIRQCKNKKVHTVFIQKEFDTRNAELVAKEIGATLVSINPLNYNWNEELIQTAKALTHGK